MHRSWTSSIAGYGCNKWCIDKLYLEYFEYCFKNKENAKKFFEKIDVNKDNCVSFREINLKIYNIIRNILDLKQTLFSKQMILLSLNIIFSDTRN